ncbi:hypothetical protein I4U23_022843 [Adineta vaga]|nr:hypothetical protein I4U23_022843 [Adineta vaga]
MNRSNVQLFDLPNEMLFYIFTQLKISNFQCDSSLLYFTNDSPFRHLLKQPIRKLDLLNGDSNIQQLNVVGTSNPALDFRTNKMSTAS